MTEREYLIAQAPLRETWLDETKPEQERQQAYQALQALVKQYSEEHPPLTGTFYYTEEMAKEARRHGF